MNLQTRVLEEAESLVSGMLYHIGNKGPEWEGRQGGYLWIARDDTNAPWLVSPVGEILPGKEEKYYKYAGMKDSVLSLNPGAVQSSKSGSVAGGVRWGVWRVSFSGFPPEGDEAYVLLLKRQVGILREKEFFDLASRCKNGLALGLADLITIPDPVVFDIAA